MKLESRQTKASARMSHPIQDERFQTLIEHSLDAIALIEPDGTVSYVSPSIVRVLGYLPDEFVKLAPFQVVHPDDRDQARERFADIVKQPAGSQTVINRARHKDGSWRWIETISTNQLENPNVQAVVANFRDITDRKQMEVALREREEHFRLIVESASDYAIFSLGLDGRIVSWNSGAERILGYREDEILGKHVSIIFTAEDNAAGRADIEMRRAAIEGRENDDRWHVKKGGNRFWATGLMMPLRDDAGQIRGYLKILRDRTEQRLAREALWTSMERLRIALDAARLGLWHCNWSAGTMIWNGRSKEHLAIPPDVEITFDTFYEQLLPEDREPTRLAVERAIAAHTPFDIVWRTRAAGGQVRWIQAIGHGFYMDSGECYRFDGVTIDITDRRLAAEALKDADHRKDEFLAILAHELRNPLSAISSAAQVALRTTDQEELAWSKDVIARQANILARLVDDLLDVSRITLGQLHLHKEPIDLVSVINRAVDSARPLFERKTHNLTVSIALETLNVVADPTRIEQAIVNLLTNAAKYTEPGGEITLAAVLHGRKVVIMVKDNGIGIPPDMLKRIFDLFAQVDQTIERSQGGLGVGLSLVRSIVELHGGTVTAASEGAGKGSLFTVMLPGRAEVESH
jgi:PAS domain S-box-containing protein